jgi:glycerol-3-phosphate dehydrogenase subunit B
VLAHYDPVAEGSGSGVAVATGWHAADQILAKVVARDSKTGSPLTSSLAREA